MMRTPCQIVRRATFSALILLKVSAIVEAGADLQLTLMRFEWYPVTKYQPLDRIGVEIALKNAGNQTSEPYTVEFYASMDTVITAEDYKMGSHSDPGLPRYGSDHFWEIAVFPWDIPDGYYYLGVMIVCPNDVNPANNNACSSVYVSITGFVDLAAQGVEPVGSYHRPGEQITISTRVKNIGRRFSEEYDVEYFLRKSEDPDADACRLGSVARGGLRGLQEDLFTTTYRCPDALDEGYYCVRVVVTCPRDTKGENNERSSQTTWIGPFADLAVESVDIADGTYALGEQAAVRSLVRNVGDKVSDPNGTAVGFGSC